MSIIKILKRKYFLILMFIILIASISSVSANGIPDSGVVNGNIYDSEIVRSGNSSYAIVNLNEKVNFIAKTVNVNTISWNFGDKTKIEKTKTKNQASSVTHTFKKVGTYNVKVDTKGLVDSINFVSTKDFITVKVVKKPDLVLTKLNYARKGKDIVGFSATVKNKGAASSKDSYIKMWYKNTNLKKESKSVKVPALKAGSSTQVLIKFQIPSKYKKYISYVKVDSTNKINESIESNNQKLLSDLIKK